MESGIYIHIIMDYKILLLMYHTISIFLKYSIIYEYDIEFIIAMVFACLH